MNHRMSDEFVSESELTQLVLFLLDNLFRRAYSRTRQSLPQFVPELDFEKNRPVARVILTFQSVTRYVQELQGGHRNGKAT